MQYNTHTLDLIYSILSPHITTTDLYSLDSVVELAQAIMIIGKYSSLEADLKLIDTNQYISSTFYMNHISGFEYVDTEIIGKSVYEISEHITKGDTKKIIDEINHQISDNEVTHSIECYNFNDGTNLRIAQREKVFNKRFSICFYQKVDFLMPELLKIILNKKFQLNGSTNGSFFVLKHTNNKENRVAQLSEYYQDIAYLITLDLSLSEIAHIIDLIKPKTDGLKRNRITIDKAKSYICQKLDLPTNNILDLKNYLYSIQYHMHLPANIFNLITSNRT